MKRIPKSLEIQFTPAPPLITLAQWRSSPELVRSAQKLFADPAFFAMMTTLRHENPAYRELPLNAPHDAYIANSCMASGYALCLANLESLAVEFKTKSLVEATFKPEPKP